MFVKIKKEQTEVIMELLIKEDGIEWTKDILGSAGVLDKADGFYKQHENDELYTCDVEVWYFWAKYIIYYDYIRNELEKIEKKYGQAERDALQLIIAHALGADYSKHFEISLSKIKKYQ